VLLYLQYESIAAAKNSKLTLLNLTTYFGYYLIWLLLNLATDRIND
jgi:hypothetical protein